MSHCWTPLRRRETWEERVESLKRRAADLGLTRQEEGIYTKVTATTNYTVVINEYDEDVLFPGEAYSSQPHFHGMRDMNKEEIEEETRKDALHFRH